jgi:hypothetical protein
MKAYVLITSQSTFEHNWLHQVATDIQYAVLEWHMHAGCWRLQVALAFTGVGLHALKQLFSLYSLYYWPFFLNPLSCSRLHIKCTASDIPGYHYIYMHVPWCNWYAFQNAWRKFHAYSLTDLAWLMMKRKLCLDFIFLSQFGLVNKKIANFSSRFTNDEEIIVFGLHRYVTVL